LLNKRSKNGWWLTPVQIINLFIKYNRCDISSTAMLTQNLGKSSPGISALDAGKKSSFCLQGAS
jgi:hypothetical protein